MSKQPTKELVLPSRAAASKYRQHELENDEAEQARRDLREEFLREFKQYQNRWGERINGRALSDLGNTNADFELLKQANRMSEGDPRRHVPMPSALEPVDEFTKLDREQLAQRIHRRTGKRPRASLSREVLLQQLRRLVAIEEGERKTSSSRQRVSA